MKLNSNDKKVLETLFRMKTGWVLDFTDNSMSTFFEEEFGIAIYDEKYDFDFQSKSKANRLRGIWQKEDEKTVGKIIFSLVDFLETDFLVKNEVIPQTTKDLAQKAREISARLILPHLIADSNPSVDALKKKTLYIKGFNSVDFQHLETNKKIYLLKVLYSYYTGILTAYYGSGLFFLTAGIDDLNDYFKILRKRMIEVVDSDKAFLELAESDAYNKVIIPITSLYSCTDYLDGMWEDYTQPALISLREEIADKDLFENYSEIHKTDVAVSLFLEAISGEIDTMNKYLAQKARSFHNALPNEKTVFDSAFKKQGEKEVVYHKHSHHFENSAQEKGIDLNYKFEGTKKTGFYITKEGDDFSYNGRYVNLSKKSDYYKVFSALYAKLPNGGEVSYKDIMAEVKSRLPKTKSKTDDEMAKFIQRNLTDKTNGFMRYAGIPDTEDGGKPLIEVIRSYGIAFNNKAG